MLTGLFAHKLKDGAVFRPEDVAWIIIMVKASRAQWSDSRDNYTDTAGYAYCGNRCMEERLKAGQVSDISRTKADKLEPETICRSCATCGAWCDSSHKGDMRCADCAANATDTNLSPRWTPKEQP